MAGKRARPKRVHTHHGDSPPTGHNPASEPHCKKGESCGLWHSLCHTKQTLPQNLGNVLTLEAQRFGSPECWKLGAENWKIY